MIDEPEQKAQLLDAVVKIRVMDLIRGLSRIVTQCPNVVSNNGFSRTPIPLLMKLLLRGSESWVWGIQTPNKGNPVSGATKWPDRFHISLLGTYTRYVKRFRQTTEPRGSLWVAQ